MVGSAAAPASDPRPLVFHAAIKHGKEIPSQFIWPDDEKPTADAVEELCVPLVDLRAFINGDAPASSEAASIVAEACGNNGFFQVVNHGVDEHLIAAVHRCMEAFFSMPLSEKQLAQRRLGESFGYSSSFTGRFSSKLPWKETLSFRHREGYGGSDVLDYFISTLGDRFRPQGELCGRYCEAMDALSKAIMELLGESLGIGRSCLPTFFEGHDSIMRLNYYPPCQRPELTLGTGPHCDPTALTILHQDHVPGLQVFHDGRWKSIAPRPGAFIVNIGDTFMALSNGRYKSCLHRAVVNRESARKSLAYFLCPGKEKVVAPTKEMMMMMEETPRRVYPDFRWPELLDFTQRHYRADGKTLEAFTKWLESAPT